MKHIIVLSLFTFAMLSAHAQSKLAGHWEGKVEAGKTVRLIFHVTESGGKIDATMDSPDQGATGIGVQSTTLVNDTVTFDMSAIGVVYKGLMMGDDIYGVWMQNGMNIPLELKRTNNPTSLARPQTPKPPFSYISEDVTYENADKSMSYGATITIPKDGKTHPAVLLISGSGQQNRDGEIKAHKPFAVIADYLTQHGYIVLRVDDRGIGKTSAGKNLMNVTTVDFAQDAGAGIDYLKTRKEVNQKKIGMIGHSEGGMIAPMVAVTRNDVDFIVMLAGPGEKVSELMEDQNAAIMKANGMDEKIIADFRKLYRGIEQAVISSSTGEEAQGKMIQVTTAWKQTACKEAIEQFGLNDYKKETELIRAYMDMYHSKWFNYFLKYDPQPTLEKLNCKVLALNGGKDVQVVPAQNLDAIRKALAKSKSKSYEVKELPGLNHLFQTCTKCTVDEYAELEETFAPVALKTIGDWLDKKVK